MSIAYHACQISNWASGTTITATMPTNTNGDVLLMSVHASGVSPLPTITDPSGWTLLCTTTYSTSLTNKIYWRVASSEPGSYTVTVGGLNFGRATVVSISGADTTQPASAQYAGQGNASSASITAPTLGSWSSANGIDVGLFGTSSGSTNVTPPTNYTEPTGGDA